MDNFKENVSAANPPGPVQRLPRKLFRSKSMRQFRLDFGTETSWEARIHVSGRSEFFSVILWSGFADFKRAPKVSGGKLRNKLSRA